MNYWKCAAHWKRAVLQELGEVMWPPDAVIIEDKIYILHGLFLGDKKVGVFKIFAEVLSRVKPELLPKTPQTQGWTFTERENKSYRRILGGCSVDLEFSTRKTPGQLMRKHVYMWSIWLRKWQELCRILSDNCLIIINWLLSMTALWCTEWPPCWGLSSRCAVIILRNHKHRKISRKTKKLLKLS